MLATPTPQEAGAGLYTDHFGGGDGQRVGIALLLQPLSQLGAVAVDRIGHHPADGQASRLGPLNHPPGQFGFGLKRDRLGDMRGLPAQRVGAPVFGQIQLAVDEGMAGGSHIGEKDADLAVFHTPGQPAILGADASRVTSAFGKATDHSTTRTGKGASPAGSSCEGSGALKLAVARARSSSRTASWSQAAAESKRCMP